MSESRFYRSGKVTWRDAPDELVLFLESAGSYHLLDDVGSDIWRLAAPGCGMNDLVAELAGQYGVTPDAIAADVSAFVEKLTALGLLVETRG